MPRFSSFRGYDVPDPLDRARGFSKYLILILVNLALTAGLLALISDKIVHFNGFTLFGHAFSPAWTFGLELAINGLVYSSIIVFLRKCSSIIHYLVVLVPYFLLDLYIESHFRTGPHADLSKALWYYLDVAPINTISFAPLKFFITLSVDAILFGIVGTFIARCIASLIKPSGQPEPTKDQYNNLFRDEWTAEPVGKPKRDLAFWVLRLLGIGYLIYLLFLVVGGFGAGPWGDVKADQSPAHLVWMTYRNPALAINTYFKISLMIMLAFTGAFNKSLRYYCCLGLFTGHLVSTAWSLVFHFYGPLEATESAFLLTSGITDGVMVLIFGWIILRFKRDGAVFAPERDNPIDFSLPMSLLQIVYRILGWVFTLFVLGIVYIRVWYKGPGGLGAIFGYPDPMIGNTVTLYSTLAILSFIQVKREQLRAFLFNPTVLPVLFGSMLALLWIMIGDMRGGVPVYLSNDDQYGVLVDWYFVLHGLSGLLICGVLIGLRRMFYRVDYSINTINPSAAIDCIALHDALYGGTDAQHAGVLQSVDEFVGGITGRKRGLLNLPFGLFENALNFIYGMRPPFSAMSRDEQRWYLQKYFLRNELQRKRAMIPPLADLAAQVGISLNTIVTFAHFNSLSTKAGIGYVPVDARDRTQGDCAAYDPPHRQIAELPRDHKDVNNFKPTSECADGPMLAPRLTTPVDIPEPPDEADYIIIGSGAGGATMAYRLACANPKATILLIERGYRYQPLQDFTDDEMEMMKKVYKEGGLQQTKSFTMTMAQGECVGGTTVINNAVCFKMPQKIRDIWQNDYGIDLSRIDQKYDLLQEELHIAPLGNEGVNQVVGDLFVDAVTEYNKRPAGGPPIQLDVPVQVNHRNNTGDGNWNLGNKRMQKRSMLETFIPWSEARGVRVIPNRMAVGFSSAPDGRAEKVWVRAENGRTTQIRVRKAVIAAGGAVASSHFLMRSGVLGNVGKRLSCNFAFPITLDFEQEIRAYDGDQITMAALDPQGRAAFETYFNPPATLALVSVPFFFHRRDSWMTRYRHLLNFGSLIGSEQGGEILQKADLVNGQAFTWTLGDTDIRRIKFALTTQVQLGALAGAKRVAVPVRPGVELDLTKKGEVEKFAQALDDYPLRITDLYIGTAHPQGGNLMAGRAAKNADWGVINENFQVKGHPNVFVADASLFPTSITVNPQWTIMAMSSLAAEKVLQLCP
ncbi:MAG: GMC family oxidoreductase N-terminal domain-containing protein [Bacteroidota bacterium]|nr:GMC family oxidoreductase N-terminal domain-containing protein [Bacteroidota bacterium]